MSHEPRSGVGTMIDKCHTREGAASQAVAVALLTGLLSTVVATSEVEFPRFR